jgi:hypothetical protein
VLQRYERLVRTYDGRLDLVFYMFKGLYCVLLGRVSGSKVELVHRCYGRFSGIQFRNSGRSARPPMVDRVQGLTVTVTGASADATGKTSPIMLLDMEGLLGLASALHIWTRSMYFSLQQLIMLVIKLTKL